MIETLGRYKVLSVLGQGAMGVVYKAIDPVIDRVVAIKTINLAISPEELAEYEARFQQEIKAAGRLNHPSIVTIYDVGKTEHVAYMAMELLDGKELKELLATNGAPPVADAVDWIAQIASALGAAHDAGIVHRDVKPSNIMIVKGGLAKITDFGIARMTASSVKTLTGMILGSPRYMSPEQVVGREIDHRSDIFSLGVVLYESLAGTPPFDGDNVNAIMYATVNHAQQPASQRNGDVPPMLDLIVAKALAKTVEERYQSMHEFATDLNMLKRQFAAAKPTPAFLAETAPSGPKGVSLEALGLSMPTELDVAASTRTSTRTMASLAPRAPTRDETTMSPIGLDDAYDSFDATRKLASLTNQDEEFSGYLSDTQKVRALNALLDERNRTQPERPAPSKPELDEATRKRREARRAARKAAAGTGSSSAEKTRTQTAATPRNNRNLAIAVGVLGITALVLMGVLIWG